MASHVVAYQTLSELNRRLTGNYLIPSLYSDKVKKIVRFLLMFNLRTIRNWRNGEE